MTTEALQYAPEAFALALPLLMAFSALQRKAILERDEHKCQATVDHECNEEKFPLEIDHILPQRMAKEMGVPEEEIDNPRNAITKCREAHDIKHPDRVGARGRYHWMKKLGLDSFKEMFAERDEKVKNHILYWNPTNDRQDYVKALKRTNEAEKKGWKFPPKKHREKKEVVVYDSNQLAAD